MNPLYSMYSDLNPSASPTSVNNNNNNNSNGGGVGFGGAAMIQSGAPDRPPMNGLINGTPTGGGPTPFMAAPVGVKMCAGCGGKIVERFLLHAMDRFWHHGCLKCSCCGVMLADMGSSCFTRAGMILCKADYIKLFGSTAACSACGQVIPASDYVMRAAAGTVYHMKCFTCVKCRNQLMPGDRYSLINGGLVCEQDCHKLLKGANTITNGPVKRGKVGRPRRNRE